MVEGLEQFAAMGIRDLVEYVAGHPNENDVVDYLMTQDPRFINRVVDEVKGRHLGDNVLFRRVYGVSRL